MTREQARAIVGNRAKWECRGIAQALSLHPWKNTEKHWNTLRALRTLGFKIRAIIPPP